MQTLYRLLGFDPTKHNLRTELMAGLTTFLTMSYILAVNPDILSSTGMDKGAVFTATALASALGTVLIAFLAKLPFAQAPGMGINAFFAFTLVAGMGYSWQTALAAVFVEGIIFILLTAFNVREQIVHCIPKTLRFAISAGIGFFIAFIGLKNSGIIVKNPATLVALGPFTPVSTLAAVGIVLSAVLMKLRVRGALFYSIAACTLIGIPLGVTVIPSGFAPLSMPKSLAPTFLQFDFKSLLNPDMALTIFALVFMDIFNTIGTLIGAAANTEMMDAEGNVKNMKEALMADAIGTSVGAVLGTSTVTTFVESIAEGGRTGLTSVTTALIFFLALFLSPLFLLVPSAASAPALIVVGFMMMRAAANIEFTDLSEGIPAFITIMTMPFSYSIATGISWGVMSYVVCKVASRKFKDISALTWVLFAVFVVKTVLDAM